jgi:hypothetical protein
LLKQIRHILDGVFYSRIIACTQNEFADRRGRQIQLSGDIRTAEPHLIDGYDADNRTDEGFVTVLEQDPAALVPSIELLGVSGQQPPHER